MRRVELEAKAGTTIYASTGGLGPGQPDRMSTEMFYKATPGSRVSLLNTDYYFNIATYAPTFDIETYVYSYAYKEEQSWTTYNHDLSGTTYQQDDYVFEQEVYFRICLKRVDAQNFTVAEAEHINELVAFYPVPTEYVEKPYFTSEIERTVETIRAKRSEQSLVIGLLTDTHVTVNGTWEDTRFNLSAVHQRVGFDAIVHLGDLTDGMVPASVTRRCATNIIHDLQANGVPLYVVIGNHDTNYFSGNPEPLTESEQYELYQRYNEGKVDGDSGKGYYFVDYKHLSLRILFLTSFDYREQIRYGYSEELLAWVELTMQQTPSGYSLLVFSHDAPLAELDFWSAMIRNGDRLMEILESEGTKNGKKVMALIHGHTHADYIYTKRAFPIVSVGCAKCEYFTDKKPEGSFTQARELNTLTQELWDTLVITPSEGRIDFVRFGAGEDRTIG